MFRTRSRDVTPTSRRNPWFDVVLPLVMLSGLAIGWWKVRPERNYGSPRERATNASCLSNLQQISEAFAQYAQDYEGGFPIAEEPDTSTNPSYYTTYRNDGSVQRENPKWPRLPIALTGYVEDASLWRCPADTGWNETRRIETWSTQQRVTPSAWAVFGTSYQYRARYGQMGLVRDDLYAPARTPLLYDRDAWHRPYGRWLLNVLLTDGHIETLTPTQFAYLRR